MNRRGAPPLPVDSTERVPPVGGGVPKWECKEKATGKGRAMSFSVPLWRWKEACHAFSPCIRVDVDCS